VTNSITGKHYRPKATKRERGYHLRTRTIRRREKWKGQKEFHRLERHQAALREGGVPSNYELGEGEVEGAGLSGDESGVEPGEEYVVVEKPSEGEDENEEMDEDWGDGGDFGGGGGGSGAVGEEVVVF
jgi:hypothetical protein